MKFNELMSSKTCLTSDQMKKVKGGAPGTCGFYAIHHTYMYVWVGDSAGPMGSTSGYEKRIVASTPKSGCGMSKEDALLMLDFYGGSGHWCCDSCASTHYCG